MNIHDAEKYYYEKRAQLTILKFFGDIYSKNVSMFDKPDLIDNDKDIGIEVTRTFYYNYSEAIKLFHSKCMLKEVGQVRPQIIKKLEKLGCSLVVKNNKYLTIVPPAFYVSTVPIMAAFSKKLEKINGGDYKKMKEYDLYIFSPLTDVYDVNAIINLKDKMICLQSKRKVAFKNVYIQDENNIFHCDLINNIVETHSFDEDDKFNICNESLASYHELVETK